METKELAIICTFVLIIVAIICGVLIYVHNSSEINVDSDSSLNSGNSINNADEIDVDSDFSLKSIVFYSDGNPNTGESATYYFGTENSGKTVDVMIKYYSNGNSLNNPSYNSVLIGSDGTVSFNDDTPMEEYPDSASIYYRYNGKEYINNVNLQEYAGTQEISF